MYTYEYYLEKDLYNQAQEVNRQLQLEIPRYEEKKRIIKKKNKPKRVIIIDLNL